MAAIDFKSNNEAVDFWRRDIGVNVVPADTVNKKPLVSWLPYQNSPIPDWQIESWKNENLFSKGLAVIPGPIWHRQDKQGLYLIFIDIDKQQGIEEFCTRNGELVSLAKIAEKFIA